MPKIVDHQARRRALAEALWRLNRRAGWEAISLRKVAAEADVSMGTVQHYFATKDQMLRFALDMMFEDVLMRIRGRVAALPEPRTPRRLVETVLGEMIPRPGRRESEGDAASIFVRRILLTPGNAADLAASNPDLSRFLAEQIRLGRAGHTSAVGPTPATEAEPGAAAEQDAAGLIALLEGLILRIAAGAETSETALVLLARQLDLVLGPAEDGRG